MTTRRQDLLNIYKKTCLFIIFCSLSTFFYNSPAFSFTIINNINGCDQVQCTKIQNGYLWVLAADNVSYLPYFIKGAGYNPMPIGRHPSDWGYAPSDPRSSINNIYDDPAILNRDFSKLRQMNANTIRVWQGNNTKIANGQFPIYMTNAATTINTDTTQNTLDLAASYGIKVIAGFWVNGLTFDSNNNIGSTDGLGNPVSRQGIINNFVAYVNTFKMDRAILFWAIGNENNLQKPPMTLQQLTAWYALVNDMAQAAHNAEGAYFHPVAVVNGEITEIGNASDGAADSQLPHLDIWGANVYRGQSFGVLFSQYAAKSNKPLWISEFGADAFSTSSSPSIIAEINNWQLQMTDPAIINQEGSQDQTTQSAWDGELWSEILNNSPVTIGGTVMEYSDNWWEPYEWFCTIPNPNNDPVIQSENVQSVAYCDSTHSNFGVPFPASPDLYNNEQWYGVMSISQNPVFGGPDIMTPRAVYSNLQAQWQNNPWATLTLNITGSGTGTISSPASFGAGLNCNFSSGLSTGNCWAAFTKNQPVTLSFSSNNNSTVTNWGVNGCASGSTTCNITPDAGIILNVTITSPPPPPVAPTILLYSLNGFYTAPAAVELIAYTLEPGGSISKVEYYNGTTLLGTSTVSTSAGQYSLFTYIWNNSTPGNYSITAKAYDTNNNAASSAPATFTITGLPTVSLTANSSSTSAPATITMTANAAEPYGTIRQVQFYNGPTSSGSNIVGTATSSPYTFVWNNVGAGNYTLTAVAFDNNNKVVSSTPVTETVTASVNPSVAPTILLYSLNGFYTAPAAVELIAYTLEPGGSISKVEYYNGTTLLGTSTVSTSAGQYSLFTYIWNNSTPGNYSITAKAYDTNNNATSSAPATFTITGLPTVSLTANSSSSTAPATITLTANAAEPYGSIRQVQFYNGPTSSGSNIVGTATSSPYTFVWNNVGAGNYTLTAVAFDNNNKVVSSTPVTETVTASVNPSVAPTILLYSLNGFYTAPAAVELIAYTLEPGGSISKVEYYNGSTLLGTSTVSTSAGQYSLFTYIWNNSTPGNYSITAKAYDTNNNATISAPTTFTITGLPTVSLTANSSSSTAPATITLTANAAEPYGSIRQVQFYNGPTSSGSNIVATATSSPYTFVWDNVPAGNYTLTAVAFDNNNKVVSSTPVTLSIDATLYKK